MKIEVMERQKQILNLIDRIEDAQEDKKTCTKNQNYEGAAKARDKEVELRHKLDEISGVKDFYKKVYDSEKALFLLESMVNSAEELRKLRPKFPEVLKYSELNNMLLTLYRQRDEAYKVMLNVREEAK